MVKKNLKSEGRGRGVQAEGTRGREGSSGGRGCGRVTAIIPKSGLQIWKQFYPLIPPTKNLHILLYIQMFRCKSQTLK